MPSGPLLTLPGGPPPPVARRILSYSARSAGRRNTDTSSKPSKSCRFPACSPVELRQPLSRRRVEDEAADDGLARGCGRGFLPDPPAPGVVDPPVAQPVRHLVSLGIELPRRSRIAIRIVPRRTVAVGVDRDADGGRSAGSGFRGEVSEAVVRLALAPAARGGRRGEPRQRMRSSRYRRSGYRRIRRSLYPAQPRSCVDAAVVCVHRSGSQVWL